MAHAIDLFGKTVGKMGATEITVPQMRDLIAAQSAETRKAILDSPDTLRELIRAELLRRTVITEAKQAAWDKRPAVALTMERAREQGLIDSYVTEKSQPEAGYPSAKEIEAAYEANKAQFRVPAQANLSQILLRVPQGAEKAVEDKAAATAREISTRIAKSEKFADLVAQYSQDEGSRKRRKP